MERLVGCSKGQAKASRLNKVERLRFVSAAELTDELILCIAPLASGGTNVENVIAWLVELAIRTNLENSSGAVEANDVEVFGSMFVVILIESAAGLLSTTATIFQTWCIVVDPASDLAVDWIDGACFDPVESR